MYPRPQQEEKTDRNRRVHDTKTNARDAHGPALSSPGEVIAVLNRTERTRTQRARQDRTKRQVVKSKKPNKLRITPGPPP